MIAEHPTNELVMRDKFPVVELFGPTLQGEGVLAGQVSYFLRTGGCTFRCTWCDSMHAVDPRQIRKNARWLSSGEIAVEAMSLLPEARDPDTSTAPRSRPWMTLTGGDPCVWDLTKVAACLRTAGFRLAVETQGARWQEWLTDCDLVTVSPKGPSSGMVSRFSIAMLQRYRARLRDRMVLKFVICSDEDLEWARRIRRLTPGARLFLSVATPIISLGGDLEADILDGYRWLAERVFACRDLHDATVLPQLHALIWGRSLGR